MKLQGLKVGNTSYYVSQKKIEEAGGLEKAVQIILDRENPPPPPPKKKKVQGEQVEELPPIDEAQAPVIEE